MDNALRPGTGPREEYACWVELRESEKEYDALLWLLDEDEGREIRADLTEVWILPWKRRLMCALTEISSSGLAMSTSVRGKEMEASATGGILGVKIGGSALFI
jgi:hypothetical protein